MKKPETKFKERVLEKLRPIEGIWHLKTQEVGRNGTPDFLFCAGGKFVAWELKVDAPVDPLQTYNLDKIEKSGGVARVVTPGNLETCLTELRGFTNGKRQRR